MHFPPNQPIPDQTLRLLNLAALPIGLAFLIPYGVIAHQVTPAIGLAPLGLSATLSCALLLLHKRKGGDWKPSNFFARLRTLLDLLCALSLIGILIPGWAVLASGRTGGWGTWRLSGGTTMVGVYGTIPLMMCFVISTFLSFRDLHHWRPQKATCPHCHASLSTTVHRNATYTPVHADEEATPGMQERSKESSPVAEPVASSSATCTPRPSTDDENARLL
ncbi:hypothetical protein LTR62_000973 [Meristemomyces frigidus]|uniref:Uncharacterized protein n=1 Tax=Meristemomyces frigidus TaxID=1508187 RepID=A0AAN7TK49_9PEZI|nr:hypothetical protein LTR62_000973 [Meristemomyces frigidus]